jgi:hypothetical protein
MTKMEKRIRQLLAIADDAPGTPEGITAAKIALKLIHAHAVDVDNDARDEPVTYRTIPNDAEWPMWRRNLAEVVARHCACRALYVNRQLRVYGHAHDLEAALTLLQLLEAQLVDEGWRYVDSLDATANHYRSVDRFLRSAVGQIRDRLEEVTAEAQESPGTALVVARGSEVDRHLSERFTVLSRRHTTDACAAGQRCLRENAVRD